MSKTSMKKENPEQETVVDEHKEVEDEEEEEEKIEQVKSKAEESNALEKLTTNADEEDSKKSVDLNSMKHLLQTLKQEEEAEKLALQKKDKELAAIKIKKEDVALIASELLLPVAVAERKLREANGDAYQCLKTLIF